MTTEKLNHFDMQKLTIGHCANFSELYVCHYKADGITVDAEKDNMKLNGFFYCKGSNCTRIKRAFSCDRYCPKITTSSINVFAMHNNSLTTADCEVAYALTEANGSLPSVRIPPTHMWNETMGILLTNCIDVQRVDDQKLIAYDCLNGTLLLEEQVIPTPFTNFTTFWKIYENSSVVLDPTQKFLPKESTVTIYNATKLFINLEGCVNTLRGECKEFLFTHGQDGDNNTAQSRFQCYYNRNHSDFVVARFDLQKTWRELLIAVVVPSTLFLISLTSLCIITQTVKVGDDAKMRCICNGDSPEPEETGNIIVTTPSSATPNDGDQVIHTLDDTNGEPAIASDKHDGSLVPEMQNLSPGSADESINITQSFPLSPSTEEQHIHCIFTESSLMVNSK